MPMHKLRIWLIVVWCMCWFQRRDILSDMQAAVTEPKQKQPCTRLDSSIIVRWLFCTQWSG